jgi:hypothetical protein
MYARVFSLYNAYICDRIHRSMTGGQSQLRHKVVVTGRPAHVDKRAGVDFIPPVRFYEFGYW